MKHHRLPARAALLLFLVLLLGSPTLSRAAAARAATVGGIATRWHIQLLQAQRMVRIPHTDFANNWAFYKDTQTFIFYVMTARISNVGTQLSDPYTDLNLAILPTRPDRNSGYSELVRDRPPQGRVMEEAARLYHGAVPWTPIKPGATTVYCLVFATLRAQSMFQLYNFTPDHRYVYLFDVGS